MTITAAADGSALGNPGPAGWAWYIDDERWAAGGWPHGTNNMGELRAVLELFRATAGTDEDLLILCDSQYVINCVTKWMRGWKAKGWRKADGKPVLNVDLLREIDAAIQGRKYRFEWVKGHVGHELNEAADKRARGAAEAFQRRRPADEGPGFGGGAPTVRPPAAAPQTQRMQPATSTLFDLDEPEAAPATDAALHEVVLRLTDGEFTRLRRRAVRADLTPEAFVKTLL